MATDDDTRTEALRYLGFDLLLRGKKDQALEHFKWAKEKVAQTSSPYWLSVAELERLEKAQEK